MGAIKAFLAGSVKLAVALLLVAVLLILGLWGVTSWQTHTKNLKEAPLATKKQWPTQQLLSSIPIDVATAWRDGQTYYQVNISDYSEEKYSRLANASLTLQFHDQDGFKLWEKEIPWGEMTGLTGKDATAVEGFSWAGDEYASADDYARAGRIDIVWRGLSPKTTPSQKNRFVSPAIPTPSPGPFPSWRSIASWRRLSVGQSEETVRTLLGEPTNVTRYGPSMHEWRYGGIVDGGEVSFSGGSVSSWREPSR